MLFKGEIEAFKIVTKLADQYGYGNLIAFLKMKWLDKLEESGLTRDDLAVNTSAYPKGSFSEKLKESE